ncbi:MAG TPA: hypothetical protein VIF57_26105 [Polyangia bacterium]|jgi:hypothetical protein
MNTAVVAVELTREQALVLFDWLARFNKDAARSLFHDEAEQRVLFDLEATLESLLSEPLAANYSELLRHARECIRDRE